MVCVFAGFLAAQSQPPAWYTQPEWWLAILAVPTLIFVAIQAVQAKNAAKAALLNAQAVIDSERAWILVEKFDGPPESWRSETSTIAPGLALGFKVYGKTSAKFIEARFACELVRAKEGIKPPAPDLPEIPNYEKATTTRDMPRGMVLPPEGQFQLCASRFITAAEKFALNTDETVLCVYGFIKYKDAFEKERETRSCYVYYIPRGGVITTPDGIALNPEGFRIGGPDEYNKAT